VKLDRWMIASGLTTIAGDIEDDARDILIENAMEFLRGGGSLSLSDWESLSDDSRAAFCTAGDRMRSVTAYLGGISSMSRTDALSVLSAADGGEMMIRTLLQKITCIAADRIEAKRPREVPAQ